MTRIVYFNYSLLVACLFFATTSSAQFVNFEETWKEFLTNNKTSNISNLTKPSKDQTVDYAKYCLMYANTHFCGGEIESADEMMSEIRRIGETGYSGIPGYKERHDDLAEKMNAYQDVAYVWSKFIEGKKVDLEELEEMKLATKVCEKGTLAKYFYMAAEAHYCNGDLKKARGSFENRVLKLAERTSLKVEDVPGLAPRVKSMKTLFQGLTALDKAWAAYMKTDESTGFTKELPLIPCNATPTIKKHLLNAAADLCGQGKSLYEEIKKVQANNRQALSSDVQKKLDWLEKEVQLHTGDLNVLNIAWTEFLATDTLKDEITFGMDYCEIDDRIKAMVMVGTVNFCSQGEEILKNIATILKEKEPELEEKTSEKVQALVARYEAQKEELNQLEDYWIDFIDNQDTLLQEYQVASSYCDALAQIKYWTVKGHLNPCDRGQVYLDRIDALDKAQEIEYTEEVECRIQRLRGKVYQCRYWELVLQARKETHTERERFGPPSAKVMEGDLNSDQLPCPTTVQYQALGNIGVHYIISTFLCQEIDLAKMGDPEYYKKIASWVDTEVLQKYCEANMRCKEDFSIYLEGHTDGHIFKGARYKKSLDIPEGSTFTHYDPEGGATTKNTEREITTSLRSNMELGIARAWTVKSQLDFMGVPISIGAYEHPKTEKGGEYRKVDIELNIHNLLLDFYEKRLQTLIEESGIGERPKDCL